MMFTGRSMVATCLLLLYTQGVAATTSTHDASRGSQLKEDVQKSAVEVNPSQNAGLGDTTADGSIDPPRPGLFMEPLPEDYTATQERKVSSTFWKVLQKRRMKALLACETTLGELMEQNMNVTYNKSSPEKVEVALGPRQSQAAGDLIPVTQGRRIVDETEAEIGKCYSEISRRAGQADPQMEIRENLLREIDHIVDQVEACTAAGGTWPSADSTQTKMGKVKAQSGKPIAHSEMLSILESSLARVLLDKQLCLESLPLPANRYISLE